MLDKELPGGLHFSTDSEPGYTRIMKRGKPTFLDNAGQKVTEKVRGRLEALVIPPAWQQVWICASPSGHLQATGRDDKGRKQAIYHPDWQAERSSQKFDHLYEFGVALPKIRKHVEAQLARRGIDHDKILAVVIRLLETTMIRIGNQRYEQENKSFGLTTLRNKHAKVIADRVEFNFIGKSGKPHLVTIRNRSLSAMIRQCQELPGQHLFSYKDDKGHIRHIDSTEVNRFLQSITNAPITAKEFRTWGGTIEAIKVVRDLHPKSPRDMAAVVKEVAQKLGNTPSVCRQSYIHPRVLDLERSEEWQADRLPRSRRYLDPYEVLFLEKICHDDC